MLATNWHNSFAAADLTGDLVVFPQDALVAINELNSPTIIESDGSLPPRDAHPNAPLYDADCDGFLAPNDVLRVINALNDDELTPTVTAQLTNDTAAPGASGTDGLTSDARISGSVSGNLTGIATLTAQLDGGAVVTLDFASDGQFSFDPGLSGASDDGDHSVRFVTLDGRSNTSTLDLSFTLDTTPPVVPTLELDQQFDTEPAGDGRTALESADLTGQTSPNTRVELIQRNVSTTADSLGNFDFSDIALEVGTNTLTVSATDPAGNESVFTTTVTRSPPDQMIELSEDGSFVQEATTLVELSRPVEGTRTISFDIQAMFDRTDQQSAIEDTLLVYLVDVEDVSKTLLDRGEQGTSLFMMAGDQIEFRPGLVRYSGSNVEIDVTGITDETQGRLVFQLLNSDNDSGTTVDIGPVQNIVDATRISSPVFPHSRDAMEVGEVLDVATLEVSTEIDLQIENVRFDSESNVYRADLLAVNRGPSIGRQAAVVFTDLPDGVSVFQPTGTDNGGNPYISLTGAIPFGGLSRNATSRRIPIELQNPAVVSFPLVAEVRTGGPNQPPVFDSLGPFTVMPGQRLEVELTATDPDNDWVTFTFSSEQVLPTGVLNGKGLLSFSPTPDQVGTYQFKLFASDGAASVSQDVTLNVVADPVTTTRLSGVVLDTSGSALPGIPLELGSLQSVTQDDGSFLLETSTAFESDTLRIRGDLLDGDDAYPFVAEKLGLLLEHELYPGVDNVVSRPIFLPALDVGGGSSINPLQSTTVTQEIAPGEIASVFVASGTLLDRQGGAFDGMLSITEVPKERTPAALPRNLSPDTVVTIQPGDMVFTEPAPLTLPNRVGYEPGTFLRLWSINPESGEFESVGFGEVSTDGANIETIEGGIRNSSWHFFAFDFGGLNSELKSMRRCACATGAATSEVEFYSGVIHEDHELPTYSSNGDIRGVTLHYDSLRADPKPIVRFEASGSRRVIAGTGQVQQQLFFARMSVSHSGLSMQLPGADGGQLGLPGGEHFWQDNGSTSFSTGLQADFSSLPSGIYGYQLDVGQALASESASSTSSRTVSGEIASVNGIGSSFGNGWGLVGFQEIVESENGTVMLIDGDGQERLFDPPGADGEPFVPRNETFTTLEKMSDGTFRHSFPDQTIYTFNADNRIASVTDRNGNDTRYVYADGQLSIIVDSTGLETSFGYEGGMVTSITDPAGRVTQLEYDENQNLRRVINPDDTSRTWSYDDSRRMTGETTLRGFTESLTYDELGRMTEAVRGDGSTIRLAAPGTQGLRSSAVTRNPETAPTVLSSGISQTALYTDPNGNVETIELDSGGQIVSVSDAIGLRSQIVRDEQDLIVRQVDGRGNESRFDHDTVGNLVTFSDDESRQAFGEILPFSTQSVEDLRSFSFQVGDVDGDSRPDFVTDIDGDLIVLPGQGNGGFGPPSSAGLVGQYRIEQLVDLNNDGQLDAILGDMSDPLTTDITNIVIALGRGDGTFRRSSELPATRVAVADINLDGNPDLVVTTIRTVSVLPPRLNVHGFNSYLGNGDGSFTLFQEGIDSSLPFNFTFADITDDGLPDLVTISGSQVGVYPGRGNGLFAPPLLSRIGPDEPTSSLLVFPSLHVGDFNQDGLSDIVTRNNGDNGLYVLINDGGRFAERIAQPVTLLRDREPIFVGDFNFDNNLDVAFATAGRAVNVLAGQGDGSFEPVRPLLFDSESTFANADVNTDGRVDFVSRDARSLLANPDGSYGESLLASDVPGSARIGDLNNDGLPDLATIDAVFLNDGNGGFAAGLGVATNGSVLELGDINNDGQLDLVTDRSYQLGLGNGTFQAEENYAEPLESQQGNIALGDLNGDGFPDVINANVDDGLVTVFLNTSGMLDAGLSIEMGEGPFQVSLGDVDNDGHLDLLANNTDGLPTAGQVVVRWRPGLGDGTFGELQTAVSVLFAHQDAQHVLQDLNSDGNLDLFVYGSDFDSFGLFSHVQAHLGRGDGTFELGFLSGFNRITSAAIGDVDQDGIPDIVAAAAEGVPELVAARGVGDGTFFERRAFTLETGNRTAHESLQLADMNGDGMTDIVSAHPGDGTVALNLSNGSSSSRSATVQTLNRSTYDSNFNQLTSRRDELGRETTYDLDEANGNTLAIHEPEGITSRLTYTQAGLLDTFTDPLGRVLENQYDGRGRLRQITLASGTADEAVRQYEYDDAGNQTALIDENGRRTTYDYDIMNRLVRISEPDPDGPAGPLTSPVTVYEYDAAGNVTRAIDPRGNPTTYELDARNRVVRTIAADGAETEFTYDDNGNLLSLTDPLGHVTRNEYDERDRRVQTIDAEGGVTQFEYDGNDNLTSLQDPTGNITRYEYDRRDRLVAETDPLGQQTLYEYDAANNLILRTDRNDRRIAYEFDGVDRITSERWLGSSGAEANVITYQYDVADNLTSVVDSFSALAFSYDDRDRITQVDNSGTPDTPAVVISYAYDALGNVTQVADAIAGTDSAVTTYQYDALDRITRISQQGAEVSAKAVDFVYNELGQFETISRFSDLNRQNEVATSSFSYDTRNRLVSLEHGRAGNPRGLAFYDLTYDSASRITAIDDQAGRTDFTYDRRDQLVATDRDASDPRGNEEYAFDASGNRTASHRAGDEFSYENGNRLLSDGTFNYEYDAEGNLTKQTRLTAAADGEFQVREFFYDHRDRLTRIVDRAGNLEVIQTIDYRYDSFGRRISRTVQVSGSAAVVTHFVYDRDNVVLDFVAADGDEATLDQRYLHGPGVDQVLAQESADGAVQWSLTDQLGTVRELVDNNGAIVNRFLFDSFGNLVEQLDATLSTRYLFTGREYEPETELYYYRARYYSPSSGRFISEDPIAFASTDVNLYRYVANDPVRFTDPSGEIIPVVAAAGVAAAKIAAGAAVGYVVAQSINAAGQALGASQQTIDRLTFIGTLAGGAVGFGRTIVGGTASRFCFAAGTQVLVIQSPDDVASNSGVFVLPTEGGNTAAWNLPLLATGITCLVTSLASWYWLHRINEDRRERAIADAADRLFQEIGLNVSPQ